MASIVSLLTAEEYGRLPEEQDRPSELVRGVIVRMNPPRFRHGIVCTNFAYALKVAAKNGDRGRVLSNDSGVITERDPDTVRGPDVAYYSYGRLPRDVEVELYPPVAPDIAIEVRSPSDRWAEIHRKVAEYLNAGVTVVIVADDDAQTVSLFYPDKAAQTLGPGDVLTVAEVLPDFSVPIAQLFE